MLKQNVDGNVIEIICDICNSVFDDPDEMEEFVCFDYETGKSSFLGDGVKIKFDVCQDCFAEKIEEYFDKLTGNEEDNTDLGEEDVTLDVNGNLIDGSDNASIDGDENLTSYEKMYGVMRGFD